MKTLIRFKTRFCNKIRKLTFAKLGKHIKFLKFAPAHENLCGTPDFLSAHILPCKKEKKKTDLQMFFGIGKPIKKLL